MNSKSGSALLEPEAVCTRYQTPQFQLLLVTKPELGYRSFVVSLNTLGAIKHVLSSSSRDVLGNQDSEAIPTGSGLASCMAATGICNVVSTV